MNTARIIRMILSALLPDFAGTATGCTGTTTAGTAAAGAPQAAQNCVLGDSSAPHFEQKLATMISLSLGFDPGISLVLFRIGQYSSI
jgi:hypothetical protein